MNKSMPHIKKIFFIFIKIYYKYVYIYIYICVHICSIYNIIYIYINICYPKLEMLVSNYSSKPGLIY